MEKDRGFDASLTPLSQISKDETIQALLRGLLYASQAADCAVLTDCRKYARKAVQAMLEPLDASPWIVEHLSPEVERDDWSDASMDDLWEAILENVPARHWESCDCSNRGEDGYCCDCGGKGGYWAEGESDDMRGRNDYAFRQLFKGVK